MADNEAIAKVEFTDDDEEDGDLEKTIYFLCNTYVGPKTAAIFQFKIRISEDGRRVDAAGNSRVLKPIETFFDEGKERLINIVGCAALGSSGCFYLIPNEIEEEDTKHFHIKIDCPRLCSFKFNPFNMETSRLHHPQTRKVFPVIVAAHDKIYALSCRNPSQMTISEPSFEAFDPIKESWEPLAQPPFNMDTPYSFGWYVMGYAVLENFIIVSLTDGMPRNALFSYNLHSQRWKDVCLENDAVFPYWEGEAVVVDGVIYAYDCFYRQLVAIHFSNESSSEKEEGNDADYDLSLKLPIGVEGLTFNPFPEEYFNSESGAIGKIGGRMLCVVHTRYPCGDTQFIHISIIDIHDCELCTTLKSFTCTLDGNKSILPDGKQFAGWWISSCLML